MELALIHHRILFAHSLRFSRRTPVFIRALLACVCVVLVLAAPSIVRTRAAVDVHTAQLPDKGADAMAVTTMPYVATAGIVPGIPLSLGPMMPLPSSGADPAPVSESEAVMLASLGLLVFGAARPATLRIRAPEPQGSSSP
jgi:hypothetical protein